MATDSMQARLSALEGYRVGIALRDGSRLDDCQLVSAGRPRTRTLWVCTGRSDVFVPITEVVDVWESPPIPPGSAAVAAA
jgi:hypothetical protein